MGSQLVLKAYQGMQVICRYRYGARVGMSTPNILIKASSLDVAPGTWITFLQI